ncbi:MAG: 50S ribosomal protein L18 [Chlamydiota bacterium]
MEKRLDKRNRQRISRSKRVRRHLKMCTNRLRLSVSKTNKHLFAQIIDDETGKTLFGIGTRGKQFQGTEFAKRSKHAAEKIGQLIAEEAKTQNIDEVVFDRGRYKYHGVIAIMADAARNHGLKF